MKNEAEASGRCRGGCLGPGGVGCLGPVKCADSEDDNDLLVSGGCWHLLALLEEADNTSRISRSCMQDAVSHPEFTPSFVLRSFSQHLATCSALVHSVLSPFSPFS